MPYANESHLKLELMDKVRELAREQNQEKHPWKSMEDMEIMRSAGLYVQNMVTGESGFNLAAVLLFGKPEVIKTCVPGYITDAIYRVDNIDEYSGGCYTACPVVGNRFLTISILRPEVYLNSLCL